MRQAPLTTQSGRDNKGKELTRRDEIAANQSGGANVGVLSLGKPPRTFQPSHHPSCAYNSSRFLRRRTCVFSPHSWQLTAQASVSSSPSIFREFSLLKIAYLSNALQRRDGHRDMTPVGNTTHNSRHTTLLRPSR